MKYLLNILFVLLSLTLTAQIQSEEELSIETLQNQNLLPQVNNGAFILQVGDANRASLNVKNDQVAKVLQQGNLNMLNLDLNGIQNNTTILQRGNQNEYNLTLSGSDNLLTVVQEGDDNKVTQSLENADNLEVELIQLGSGHELIQLGGGVEASPMQVVQQGTGMKVIIEKKDF